MADLEPIGKYLEGLRVMLRTEDGEEVVVEPIGDAPSPSMLLDPRITPPRAVVEGALAGLRVTLARPWLADRAHYEQEMGRWEKLLRWNDLKDEIQATRPPGCWCLGRGFREPLPHEIPPEFEGVMDAGETSYPRLKPSEPIYCGCDKGALARSLHAVARDEEERRRRAARLGRLWKSSGIRADLPSLSGKTWIEAIKARDPGYVAAARDILNALVAWDATDAWLWLAGPHGRGKIVLAQLLAARRAERHGETVLFRPAPDLLDDIRLSYRSDDERPAAELVRSLKDVDVLVVDDVGKERASDWVRERFYVLVNGRSNAGRRTLFTSNLGLHDPELARRLDESTVQRIAQRCGEEGVVNLFGPNLRAAATH